MRSTREMMCHPLQEDIEHKEFMETMNNIQLNLAKISLSLNDIATTLKEIYDYGLPIHDHRH